MEMEISIYNDVWMDNAVENFYRLIEDSDEGLDITLGKTELTVNNFNKEDFKDILSDIIQDNRNNLIVTNKDKKTGEIKEIKKDFVLIQEGKKIDGIVAFKENIYTESEKSVNEILDLMETDGKKTCILCGKTFSKPFKKMQQATYPFATKIKSLSGIRTYKDGTFYAFKEYHDSFCPTCYLIGILEWLDDRIIYRTFPGDRTFLFLPYFDNFEDLAEFKGEYEPLLNKSERYSNIRVNIGENKTEGTPGKFSTLLCFYDKFLFDIENLNIIGANWAILEVPFGSVKNVKLRVLNLTDFTLGVMKEFIEDNESRIYTDLIKEIYFFIDNPKGAPVDWDLTRKIQEKLSESFLMNDFRHFARMLLPRKGGRVGYSKETRENLENLIYIWRLEQMGIPKEALNSIKEVGKIVAKVSENNVSLLYKLDKTRTPEEFLGVLREISRKLIGIDLKDLRKSKIQVTALDEIILLLKDHEKEWKEIRDLLVIYSAMYYAMGSRRLNNE
ncbi:hypothetical protein [Methanobacterium formicicum]|uniref:Uncharacterized protein n=1 Tax=Methanobacterium formicicum TaxID=2162 RepID=A0A089ZBS0_METFO|nr:hypothetical protein [Methanobacterium formicicum]AIS32256.1 hypothetical protein BRM9_1442 [Methanobacterium formicicum]CEL24506.1 hypothetical protein MB9_0865 [Methanobacterium formicicum]